MWNCGNFLFEGYVRYLQSGAQFGKWPVDRKVVFCLGEQKRKKYLLKLNVSTKHEYRDITAFQLSQRAERSYSFD